MSFAQLTSRESLRDIENCLVASGIPRSTLADANESRDWRIYADYAQCLIRKARPLYFDDPEFRLDMDNMVYALDSTTIDLCLSMFPWAKFRKAKGAVKMHTLLDLRGSIPIYIDITTGSVHDVNILDTMPIEPGSYYIMDKGYRMHSLLQERKTISAIALFSVLKLTRIPEYLKISSFLLMVSILQKNILRCFVSLPTRIFLMVRCTIL
jgi:hypothetical protein